MASFFNDRIRHQRQSLLAFSGSPIERWSEGRESLDAATVLAGENAAVYLLRDDRALVRVNGEGQQAGFAPAEAREFGLDSDSLIVLGIVGAGPRLAGHVAPDLALPEDIKIIDLRSLAIEGAMAQGDLAALAQARSYLFWHNANRFCGRCGSAMAAKGGGGSRVCRNCSNEIFPRVDPVVIMLAIDGERCLLGRQPRFAPGMYSALAGFLEPAETIEEAVRREVKEESGIRVGRVAYHSSQPWPFPSSLMIGCHAEALSTEVERDAAELEDCRWFEREEVRLMLAGAHPDGLKAPFPMAIAHHLIKAFADARD
jgi:NAD+ diphosphatase